jgi:lysophospholipase L1-like esterase
MPSPATRLIWHLCFALLLAAGVPRPGRTEPLPADLQRFATEIAGYEQADRWQFPDQGRILFLGSSTIRMWTTLAQDFPEHSVLNRGFGGARIAEITQNLDRIVFPYAPRQIVFFAGGNDLADGHSPEQAVADFRAFVAQVRQRLPKIPVIYIGIYHNPFRWIYRDKFETANALIAEFCQRTPGLVFLETAPSFLGEDGRPRRTHFAEDQLHLNASGYRVLSALLRPHLIKQHGPGAPGS